MSKILVTGSRGTIGKRLVNELRYRGNLVSEVDIKHDYGDDYYRADISESRQIERVIKETKPDFVYHLAAEFGRINGEEYYDQVWKTNAIGTRNILEIQRKYHFKLIFASTSEVYGNSVSPILEEGEPNVYTPKLTNDYAISKWVNEQQIKNFADRYGNKSVILRFFNAYGPGEFFHPYRSVVCLFCYAALHGKPWTVYENYHRVFMYIDDFIPTLANVADNFHAGDIINIGGNEYRSVKELSDIILRETGADPNLVTYLEQDLHNVTNKKPDIHLARQNYGHDPVVTLEEGIPKTLEWMKKVYFMRPKVILTDAS